MKMRQNYILIALFVLGFGFAQQREVKKANEQYENYAYIDAISIYKKVAANGYEDPEVYKKLGNSYYFNSEFKEAGSWYKKLFELTSDVEPEYLFRYSQCLKNGGDYELANNYLEKFSKASQDSRAKKYIENKDYLRSIKDNSERYSIEDAGINSEYSDYGGTFYKDQFVFTSTRDKGGVSKIQHAWTSQSFSKLYVADMSSEGTLINPNEFSKNLTSKFNESTLVFTKDGNTVFFTRNNFIKGKKGTNKNDIVLLKLYKATKVNGEWTNIKELPFNSNEYSTAHPTLSSDEKTLYFASDMPGTRGQADIFKVSINEDGSFGNPINLGDKINTEGKETFPFINANNELYFASDGHLGLGGLDIFSLKINENGTFTDIYNVGTPVNSSADDFSYIIDETTRTGYFSSNREGGKGYDDIYKFKEEIPLPFNAKQEIEGIVYEEGTNEIIPSASVILFDENMNQIDQTFTDENGKYNFKNLKGNENYSVRFAAKDFETKEVNITTGKTNGITNLETSFQRNIQKVTIGSDLAKTFKINIIYFDLNKSNIRKDASVDLAKIVEVLKENTTMKIEIKSHTDSRQTAAYNLKLSNKRAEATAKWMIKNGIDASRLTWKGYGESQLINNCSDGINCTEEQHQENRRSEFIILEL